MDNPAVTDLASLLLVSILWGATNPFIKSGGQGIERIEQEDKASQLFSELRFLIGNWKWLLPFLLNQTGSVVYYLTLASIDISLAGPLTNSLTFIFTGVAGKFAGEQFGNRDTYCGSFLILAGVTLCILSKIQPVGLPSF